MDGHPTDVTQGVSQAVPVTGAGDDLALAGRASIPRPPEAGARGRGRHDLVRGREFLALHARASPRAARARWGRLGSGGIARTRADRREVSVRLAAHPCRLAGAVAGIPHQEAWALWQPAQQTRPQEPDQRGRRWRAPPLRLLPLWIAIHGDQPRERPGPDRTRPLDQHRPPNPPRPPPLCRITVGRAHAITMASLAEDVGPWTFCTRVIASQEHRAWRDDRGQEHRDHQASQGPGGPSAL